MSATIAMRYSVLYSFSMPSESELEPSLGLAFFSALGSALGSALRAKREGAEGTEKPLDRQRRLVLASNRSKSGHLAMAHGAERPFISEPNGVEIQWK